MSRGECIVEALRLLDSIEEDLRRELPRECFKEAKVVIDELRRELTSH